MYILCVICFEKTKDVFIGTTKFQRLLIHLFTFHMNWILVCKEDLVCLCVFFLYCPGILKPDVVKAFHY